MNLEKIAQYRLIRRETLTDIHTEGYLLEHRKTHARVLVLENDDENKVFNIAFRTPPSQSRCQSLRCERKGVCRRQTPEIPAGLLQARARPQASDR